MKKVLGLVIILCCSAGSLAQRREPNAFRFVARENGHAAELVVRTIAFDRSRRRITYADQAYLRRNRITLAPGVSLVTMIDGREPFGTDGEIPRVEIESMTLSFDGLRVVVPQRLYADCYNPSLGRDDFAVRLSDDGESLLAFMAGSDGAGSYQVMWVLRKDGRHTRFVKKCSECDHTDVLDFLRRR